MRFQDKVAVITAMALFGRSFIFGCLEEGVVNLREGGAGLRINH